MKHCLLLSSMIFIIALDAYAETYVVNPEGTGDFPTIQAAIDAVQNGDIIELTDGTFTGDGNRDIDYLGKAITVRSQNGNPGACIIDCEGSPAEHHRGFHFHLGEGSGSVLEGITITNGYAEGEYPECGGAGVICSYSSPTLANCVFSRNSTNESGGGVTCHTASPAITDCTFFENSADRWGGGLESNYSATPVLTNCTFSGNSAGLGGGGLCCDYMASATLTGCTFFGNSATSGGTALYCYWFSSATLENTIIAFGGQGRAVVCTEIYIPSLTCCDIYGNAGGDWVGGIAGQHGVNGNISDDPQFCDAENEDFTLHSSSPCAPDCNPECGLLGAWPVGCGVLYSACCVGEVCEVLSQEACTAAGGEWLAGVESCDPNPCVSHVYAVNPEGTGDFPTIQAAIDAVEDRDIIELTDGTFSGDGNRDIEYLGKAITVRSQSGNPEACIIDCGGTAAEPHRGFYFHMGEGPGSVLEGVTVINGYTGGSYPATCGGGIHCSYTSPTLANCVFSHNVAAGTGDGGGARCRGGSPMLTDCIFSGNSADWGGGMACDYHAAAILTNCTFSGNSAMDNGGGMLCYDVSSPVLTNCTFSGNSAGLGGGIACAYDASPTLENTVIALSTQGEAVHCSNSTPSLTCCDLYGNAGGDWVGYIAPQYGVEGNICEDPLFCDPGSEDFRLQESSPCAPFSAPNPECDLIGAWPVGCGATMFACCIGEVCEILSLEDCTAAGGEWLVGIESCDPNPCLRYACCIGEVCEILSQEECTAAGGEWLMGVESCDPNPCLPHVYVVNPEGTGDFPIIQAAIDAARDGDTIELTDGTFTGDGNRDIDYLGKAITVRSQSGDPDACIIDCEGSAAEYHRGFYFHFGEGPESVLEGVTVTGGYIVGQHGGAVLCQNSSSPSFSNCVFSGSSARYGGGLACTDFASPTLVNCTFYGNTAGLGAFPHGGGLSCWNGCSPTVTNCTFFGNSAQRFGGGMYSNGSSPTVTGCSFSENAAAKGGGLYCFESSPEVTSCTFSGNAAGETGGGMECFSNASPTAVNCTFFGNLAPNGGGGMKIWDSSLVTLENTIIGFSIVGEAIHCESGGATLTCCDIYGNAGGDWVGCIAGQLGVNGNICEDPLFCDPDGGDFRLQEGSPCGPFSPPNPECDLIGAWAVGCYAAIDEQASSVSTLYLGPSVPSPFGSSTLITYGIPSTTGNSLVTLGIYDATGRLVRVLVHEPRPTGIHRILWDGANQVGRPAEGGVYFYRLSVGEKSLTKRMVLVR